METKVLAMDFTKGDERDYAALQLLISPIEVTILGKSAIYDFKSNELYEVMLILTLYCSNAQSTMWVPTMKSPHSLRMNLKR